MALGVALVFGLASWRYFNGEIEQVTIAKPAAPVVAKPLAPAAATDAVSSLNQVELAQQILTDDVQLLEGRLAKQDAEIKRLKADLEVLSRRYDALSSFAATPKEVKPEPVVQAAKKKKKRFVRHSKKRAKT